MLSNLALDQRVSQDHPLRAIRDLADQVFSGMSDGFDAVQSKTSGVSIPPEKLLRAHLIQILYSVRSDSLLMEQIDYSLSFRWFVGMNLDERIWDVAAFTECRDRMLREDLVREFLNKVVSQAREKNLIGSEHFTLDRPLIETWSVAPRPGSIAAAERQDLLAERSVTRQSAVVAGIVYALLILIMWGAFNPRSGLGYETSFPYHSETMTFWNGFLYGGDPLRIHTSTFYHLSYLAAKTIGIGGSYVPFQVVYAMLWWARCFLVFLLLRRFLPGQLAVCYVAGALVAVHASDGALQWVGQMNQFGFIFWMLLACYFLTLAFDSSKTILAAALTIAACFFEYMSLWSYESQIFILAAFPLVLLMREREWRRLALISTAWYSVPAFYVIRTIQKYARSGGHTYQESVMRKSWSVSSIISDWYFNIAASLEFWRWQSNNWKAPRNSAILLAAVAALIFVLGGLAVIYLARKHLRQDSLAVSQRVWWTLLGVGLVSLTLSFPVYLLLSSARGLWRTQFLSGIGAALVLTALLGVSSQLIPGRRPKHALFLFLAALIVWFGSTGAIQKGAYHRWIWERHRAAILEVLNVAPGVKPDSLIVLTKVPKANDPFGDSMWFDMALRLVYPGVQVSGVYFYDNGMPARGPHFIGEGEHWKWDGNGYPPLLREAPIANTLVIELDASGKGGIAQAMPPFICQGRCATELYSPTSVITGPMSLLAIRRYRP